MSKKITTSFGFDVTAAEDAAEAIGDFDTFEKLVALDKGDASVLPELLDIVFGGEGKKELREKLKEKFGRVKTKDVFTVFREAVPQLSEGAKK